MTASCWEATTNSEASRALTWLVSKVSAESDGTSSTAESIERCRGADRSKEVASITLSPNNLWRMTSHRGPEQLVET